MGDEVVVEALPVVPASVLSPLWGTLLSMGGLVLVIGSLSYAVVQMSAYESEIERLSAQLINAAPASEAPAAEASAEPPPPSEAPSAPPTVYVTETVAAAPAPAPTRVAPPPRQPPAGAAGADRTRQLQAQVASLQSQLERSQVDLAAARRENAASDDAAKQCTARLDRAQSTAKDAQALLDRLQTVCRAANGVRPQ